MRGHEHEPETPVRTPGTRDPGRNALHDVLRLQRTAGNRTTALTLIALQRQQGRPRRQQAAPVGLLTVRGEGAGTRTLYAQEEIHATGFAAAADARAAVPSSLRTVVAIVRQGTRFHVYDTHVVCPRPREEAGVTAVSFTPLGRPDFDPVAFVNVDVTPDPAAMAGEHPEQSGTVRAGGSDAARHFESAVSGTLGLTADQAMRCRIAIESVTGPEVELRDEFVFPFYSDHKLVIAAGHDLDEMNRKDEDAEFPEFGGRVRLHPRVLDFPPPQLGALLFHEALHGREHRPSAGFGIGTPTQTAFEAESYALQHVMLNRGEADVALRDLRSVFATGGGEIERPFLPRFQEQWRQWYSVLTVLYAVVDRRVPGDAAPVVDGRRLTPATARDLVLAFARDFSHGATFDPIVAWPGRQAAEYRCPW